MSDITRRLMRLLRHMQLYNEVLETRTPPRFYHAKLLLDLSIIECERLPDDPSVVSSWEIILRNTHAKTLFITIFNLTPLHGVRQIFSVDEGNGKAVVPEDPVSSIIDISVPESLLQRYQSDLSFKMRDILKIFITTEHVNLRHLELEDMTEDLVAAPRHGKVRRSLGGMQAAWWVEEKEIITQSQCAGV
jgi:hypothetical protein